MSFLDLNLNDVKELKAVEEGEHELRLLDLELRTVNNPNSDFNGAQFLLAKMDIPSDPDSKNVTHTLFLPRDADDEKTKNNRLRAIKMFCECFDIDYSNGIDIEAVKNAGLTGWAILKIEEDEEYGEQNRVRRFVTGS